MAPRVSGSRGLNFKGSFDIDEILTNQRKVIAGFGDLRAAAQAAVNAGGTSPVSNGSALREQQLLTAQALRDARLETQRLRTEEQLLRNEQAASRASTSQLTNQITANRLAQQQLAIQTRAARQAQIGASGSYREAQQRLTQLGNQIRNVEGGFSALGRVQQARIAEYRRLNEQLQEFDRRLGNNQRNVGNYRSALNGVGGVLTGLVAGYVSAAAAIGAASAAFTQALKSDAVRASLEFTFGSVDLVDAKLEQLEKRADTLGLNYNSLTNTYKSFTGAVIASNFNFQEGERIFNAVSGAASRLKLSGDKLEGSLLAIQQMISKGNVQAEELRGQLSERLPGAFALAAKAMGVTEKELNKMLQKGEVLASDLLPKLATVLEKTFDTNTTTKVDGLTAATERFFNVFSTGGSDSRISRAFTVIVDGVGRMFKAIKDMINSDSWAELQARLFISDDGKTGDNIRDIGRAIEETNKAVNGSLGVDGKSDPKTILSTYELLKVSYDNATDALERFNKGLKDGSLVDSNNALQRLQNSVEIAGSKLKQFSKLLPRSSGSGGGISDAEKRAIESSINQRNTLQQRIDEINKASLRKQLSQDEEEIQAVKDKYTKIRNEIEEFYRKTGKRAKVDASGLSVSQQREIDQITAKQRLEITKQTIDKQKVIFTEYEQFKSDVGEKVARDRFRDDIQGFTDYVAYLKSIVPDAGETSTYANQLRDELNKKLIPAAEKEALKQQGDYYTKLLSATETFADERAKKIADGETAVQELLNRKHFERAEQLRGQNAVELEIFDEGYRDKLPALKKLYDGIDDLSTKSAGKVVANAKSSVEELFNQGKITKAVYDQIMKLIRESERSLRERLPDSLIDIANQIDGIVNAIGSADTEFGKMLSTVSNVVGQVGNIGKGIQAFKAAQGKGDVLGSLGAGLGIFGAGISIFKSVFSLFDRSKQREEQAAYAANLQEKRNQAINKSLERQIELLDEVYGADRINKYNEAIRQATENQEKFQGQLAGRFSLTGNKYIDDILTKINNGEGTGVFGLSTESFIKKNQEVLNKLKLPSGISDLQKLLDEEKLDASTSVIVQNLIQANKAAVELQNNLRASNVGSSLNEIADAFISELTEGTRNFEESFTDAIQKSILNGFKSKLIEDQLQAFYKQFADLSEGGLTKEEIEVLRKSYITASEQAKKDIEVLEKATGIDLTGKGTSKSGIPGKLQRELTETTGSEFLGVTRNIYEISVKQLNVMTATASVLRSSNEHLSGININTFNTVEELKKLRLEMKGLTTQDLGI